LPTVAALVDDSASMGIIDRYDDKRLESVVGQRIEAAGLEQPDRLSLAKTVLAKKGTNLLESVGRDYRLKLYFVSSAARAAEGELAELRTQVDALEPTGESSRLGAGIRQVLGDLRGSPP